IYNLNKNVWNTICRTWKDPPNHLDWDIEGKTVRIGTENGDFSYFDAGTGREIEDCSDEPNWCSVTCRVLGDVNTTCMTNDTMLLAAGDRRRGFVKLYDYPVSNERARFKKYPGHGSYVACVRW